MTETFNEKVAEKKLDNLYSYDLINYSVPDEIMVTITLAEYRELVKTKAKHDYVVSEKNSEISKKESKICDLENQVAKLIGRLVELDVDEE